MLQPAIFLHAILHWIVNFRFAFTIIYKIITKFEFEISKLKLTKNILYKIKIDYYKESTLLLTMQKRQSE